MWCECQTLWCDFSKFGAIFSVLGATPIFFQYIPDSKHSIGTSCVHYLKIISFNARHSLSNANRYMKFIHVPVCILRYLIMIAIFVVDYKIQQNYLQLNLNMKGLLHHLVYLLHLILYESIQYILHFLVKYLVLN